MERVSRWLYAIWVSMCMAFRFLCYASYAYAYSFLNYYTIRTYTYITAVVNKSGHVSFLSGINYILLIQLEKVTALDSCRFVSLLSGR